MAKRVTAAGGFHSFTSHGLGQSRASRRRSRSRATYISVIGMGVLFAFVTWMLVADWGADNITHAVQQQYSCHIVSMFYPQTHRVFSCVILGSGSLPLEC